jgi:hypothetical protein
MRQKSAFPETVVDVTVDAVTIQAETLSAAEAMLGIDDMATDNQQRLTVRPTPGGRLTVLPAVKVPVPRLSWFRMEPPTMAHHSLYWNYSILTAH